MSSSKRVLTIIIFLILILIVVGGAYYLGLHNRSSSTEGDGLINNGGSLSPSGTPRAVIEILSKPSTTTVQVGRTETIAVELPSTNRTKPTAFDLTFTFDKNLVEVVNIVPGRLWSSSNVLKKVIDNNNGTVRLAAGQGFNAQTTNNVDIVEIEYRVLSSGNIVFEILPTSQFAYVGQDYATNVTSSQIVVRAVD